MDTLRAVSQPALPLIPRYLITDREEIRRIYANDGKTQCAARLALEQQYAELLTPTDRFNRKLVSYQANKKAQLHSWLKYKENAVQRGQFYALNLARLGFDQILDRIEVLAKNSDSEIWRESAERRGIDTKALDILDQRLLRYPLYFCDPDDLVNEPFLTLYYRNVAMTSAKVMRGIGLDTAPHERGIAPSPDKALQLATFFNSTVSKLIVQNPTLITHRRHIEMVLTNIGESLGGSWRNEIGRLAYAEVSHLLLLFLHSHGWLVEVTYDLKGPLGVPGEEEDDTLSAQDLTLRDDPDLARNLQTLESNRVVYKSILLTNGSSLLLNRQITWLNDQGDQYKIGPDLAAIWRTGLLAWSGELKGGADQVH